MDAPIAQSQRPFGGWWALSSWALATCQGHAKRLPGVSALKPHNRPPPRPGEANVFTVPTQERPSEVRELKPPP